MTDQHPQDIFAPAIHLLFSSPTVLLPDESILRARIAPLEAAIQPSDVRVSWQMQSVQRSVGEIRFGKHRIQITTLSAPLPNAVINRTVHVTHWQPGIKAAMRSHHAHLTLVYQGDHHNPVEKMLALYQTASAFQNENLSGIANQQAWTAHPAADFLSAERIASYRREFPFMLWVGYVKFFTDKDQYWLATKGHHIFDVPDLAYFIKSEDNEPAITDVFANIFYYLYEHDVFVTAGDTLEIGENDQVFKFTKIPEDAPFLMGPSGTLAVKKITPADNPSEN
jgi:hypothetical protein